MLNLNPGDRLQIKKTDFSVSGLAIMHSAGDYWAEWLITCPGKEECWLVQDENGICLYERTRITPLISFTDIKPATFFTHENREFYPVNKYTAEVTETAGETELLKPGDKMETAELLDGLQRPYTFTQINGMFWAYKGEILQNSDLIFYS